MTTNLISSLLTTSPLLVSVCDNVLYSQGRSKNVGLRTAEPDDIYGRLTNHTIVVYGIDDKNNYLIADPWHEPGTHVIEPERLLASIAAAQMECDNLLFQLQV